MTFLPGIVVWLPAFQLNQAEKTASHVGLILTGTVDKTSLSHLRDSATTLASAKKETATSNVSSEMAGGNQRAFFGLSAGALLVN